jgi:hypothetical protein
MSPVPRSFHILTSFSHESDSHRNNFARLCAKEGVAEVGALRN